MTPKISDILKEPYDSRPFQVVYREIGGGWVADELWFDTLKEAEDFVEECKVEAAELTESPDEYVIMEAKIIKHYPAVERP